MLAEYSAIAAFADVVGALTQARAPLDLVGMTSDFLADEVRHVELASRVLMQLGGAPARAFDPSQLTRATPSALTAFQRANELTLRVSCIAEVFARASAAPIMQETTHPLLRSVYESILRDEARHRRMGTLYFEWAGDRLDDAERTRLGQVTLDALRGHAPIWHRAEILADSRPEWRNFRVQELGWIEPSRYVPLVREVVRSEILRPLRALGLVLPEEEIDRLLA